jgi:hypothetical protein
VDWWTCQKAHIPGCTAIEFACCGTMLATIAPAPLSTLSCPVVSCPVVPVVLQARGSSGRPLIECCYCQAVVLVDELKRCGSPAALVLDATSLASGSRSSNEGAGS